MRRTFVVVLLSLLIGGCAVSTVSDGSASPSVTSSAQPGSPSSTQGDRQNGVVNFVANRNGVQIFGSRTFDMFTGNNGVSRANFGDKLIVTCYAANNTDAYGSVNGLYLIKNGPFQGGWVPANVMHNHPTKKVGDTSTPDRDQRVPDCP